MAVYPRILTKPAVSTLVRKIQWWEPKALMGQFPQPGCFPKEMTFYLSHTLLHGPRVPDGLDE